MAPYNSTAIIFKDFVNDGKVPESNFVVEQQQVRLYRKSNQSAPAGMWLPGWQLSLLVHSAGQLHRVLHAAGPKSSFEDDVHLKHTPEFDSVPFDSSCRWTLMP
jgi:hypothetical protein